MEIIGTGLDATEIARIADAIERYGDRFVKRIFTDEEIAYCRRRRDFASSFAANRAAKDEAKSRRRRQYAISPSVKIRFTNRSP